MSVLRFEILSGTDVVKTVSPDGDLVLLGRGEEADIRLDHAAVHREHAQIVVGRSKVTLRATSSAAEIAVERDSVSIRPDEGSTRLEVQDGDILVLGEAGAARVRLCLAEDPEPEHVLEVRGLGALAASAPPEDRREALLTALTNIERATADATEIGPVLRAIADASLAIVPRATHATVVLQDPPGDPDAGYAPMVTRARGTDGRGRTPEAPPRVARSVFRKVVRDQAAVVVANAVGSELSSESLLGAGIMSTMGVPLWNGAGVVGVLQLDSRDAPAVFGADDVDALAVLASSAALALRSVLLIHRLRLAEEQLTTENRFLKGRDRSRRAGGIEIIGESTPIQTLLAQLGKVAATRAAVLILGETGTGKELVAQAVHDRSPRRTQLFVAQNCAALPEQLLESELFGHKRGAFTGATDEKKGLFEIADGGTLFLDEIGEMSLAVQAKLLRVLQEGEIRRVGAAHSKTVDVRIVSATNRDLEAEVKAGRFREDVYYRLAVFPLVVPPLRERKNDVRLIAASFLARYQRELGKTLTGFADETLDLLAHYEWPGNVRELDNEVQRLVIQADPGGPITPELLSSRIRKIDHVLGNAGAPREGTLKKMMDSVERHLVLETLTAHGQNKTSAARALGITREGLHKKLKQLGIG